jgi:hypothetical protein
LDRIIRTEMAAGRKVKAILAEYSALLESARETPGLTEDAEDALLDVLDGLTGNCHRDWRYLDPPALPTEEEITELPRWARVAFAARCARRVLPLCRHFWRNASSEQITVVTQAVELAERSAAKANAVLDVYGVAEAAANASMRHQLSRFDKDFNPRAAEDAANAATAPDTFAGSVPLFADAIVAVSNAADTAANAAKAATDFNATATNTTYAAANAANAVENAGYAANGAATANARERAVQAIAHDFQIISAVARVEHWTHDTSVPPEFFGPLWPEGAPPGWPTDPDPPQHSTLELDLVAGERVIDRIVENEAVNLFNALNRYHIARGRSPLTLDELLPYLPILARVEV